MTLRNIIYLFTTLLLCSCTIQKPLNSHTLQPTAFATTTTHSLASRFAPIIITDHPLASYNRIGAPMATYDDNGKEHIIVNPERPVFYFQNTTFTTTQASYSNLIYRIHFESVPFSLVPFHLTAGSNVGILIIVTINQQQQPVLITTVHTCGCYLAFTPTQHMPEHALPAGWNKAEQHVYGQTLPGLLQWQDQHQQLVIKLEDGTHRIRDIQTSPIPQLNDKFNVITTAIEAVETLKRLPLGDTTTSFFETEGDRKGYVKGSHKPWEFLLMSWWAWDKNIGVDKDYGDAVKTGSVFYTDLNPANREASDMWPFSKFLHYWGWRL